MIEILIITLIKRILPRLDYLGQKELIQKLSKQGIKILKAKIVNDNLTVSPQKKQMNSIKRELKIRNPIKRPKYSKIKLKRGLKK